MGVPGHSGHRRREVGDGGPGISGARYAPGREGKGVGLSLGGQADMEGSLWGYWLGSEDTGTFLSPLLPENIMVLVE